MPDKQTDMLQFWTERVNRYGTDPKSNTNDVWLREVEIASVQRVLERLKPNQVLDFGCANGYTTQLLAQMFPDVCFQGVDINASMIGAAQLLPSLRNLTFRCANVLTDDVGHEFDVILSIRAFQNLQSLSAQQDIFDQLHTLLTPRGHFFFIESYADGYKQINRDRVHLGLPALPIHSHLTLLTEAFDAHVSKNMDLIERGSPSSVYYLVTRLIYSKLASLNGEGIDYNHPLHQLAAIVPQFGEYGPERSGLFRKRTIQ